MVMADDDVERRAPAATCSVSAPEAVCSASARTAAARASRASPARPALAATLALPPPYPRWLWRCRRLPPRRPG
jgi:hypothetical protein